MKELSKMIILLSVVLSVFALLSACAGPGLVNEQEDPLVVYTNESHAFTVKYPNYWVKRPLKTSEVLSVAPTPIRRSLPAISVSVSDFPQGFKMADLPEETAKLLKRAYPWASPFNRKSNDIKLNDGSLALATTYTWENHSGGVRFYGVQVSAVKDQKLVTVFAINAKYRGSLEYLRQYAGSLKFLETGTAGISSAENGVKALEKDRAQEKIQNAGVKEDTMGKQTSETAFNFTLPLSNMTVNDLKQIELDVRLKNKPPLFAPTPEGHVDIRGVKMRKRAIQLSEILEDVEAIEKYEPENLSDLPHTGFVVQNDTDRIVTMKIKGNADKKIIVPAGDTSAMALPVGTYKYSFSTDKDGSLKNFSGERAVLNKSRYLFKFYLKE